MSRRYEPFTLKQTNISQPRLQPSASRQSISATEEFQSARSSPDIEAQRRSPIRRASTGSNEVLLRHEDTFSTPPSTPPLHSRGISNESNAPILPSGHQSTGPATADSALVHSPNVRFDRGAIRRKPVGSPPSQRQSRIQSGSMSSSDDRAITPGGDDTPYIHFAIDQLTRDEEVRGSRQYMHRSVQSMSEVEYREPAERDVFAGEPIYPPRSDSIRSPTTRVRHPSFRQPEAEYVQPMVAEIEEGRPETDLYLSPVPTASPPRPQDVLIPHEKSPPHLHFLPGILRPVWMGLFLFLLLWVLIGLIVGGAWSKTHSGLAAYTTFGGGRYFAFQYLPMLLATVMFVWLLQIQVAIKRIAPFLAMSSLNSTSRSEGPLMPVMPSQFLAPDLHYFKARQMILGVCSVIFWLQIIDLPLIGCLYNVYFYGPQQNGTWTWLAVQGINWTLFVLYLLQFIAVATIAIWINFQKTGLKWDPRSLADVIAMLDRSNALRAYDGSDLFTSKKDFRKRLANRNDRIGFWITSAQRADVFYTIGEEGADTRRYTLDRGKPRLEPHSSFPDSNNSDVHAPSVDLESQEAYEKARFSYLPWYIRPVWLLLWTLIAIILYLAFLVASFVNSAVIHGFAPLTAVAPSAQGFSSANFLYSFIPGVIAQALFLCWLSLDYAFRRLQPYANLAHDEGASAERSLLLEYPAQLPFSITLQAALNGDMHVAWFSFMSVIAAILPTLASGCFWAQFYVSDQQVRIAVDPSAFYALCVFLALYAFSLPLAFFGLNFRRLPHAASTLSEQIAWFYESQIVGEREWKAPLNRRIDMVTRLARPTTMEEKSVDGGLGWFYFGRIIGRDGKTRVGIDRIGRDATAANRQSGHWFGQRMAATPTALLATVAQQPSHSRLTTPNPNTPLGEKWGTAWPLPHEAPNYR